MPAVTADSTIIVPFRLTPDELERLDSKRKPRETRSDAIRRLLKLREEAA